MPVLQLYLDGSIVTYRETTPDERDAVRQGQKKRWERYQQEKQEQVDRAAWQRDQDAVFKVMTIPVQTSKGTVYAAADEASLNPTYFPDMGLSSAYNFRKAVDTAPTKTLANFNDVIEDTKFNSVHQGYFRDTFAETFGVDPGEQPQHSIGVEVVPIDGNGNELDEDTLEIINRINEQKRSPINRKARRKIKSGIILLEKKYGKNAIALVTLNYPDMDSKNTYLIILHWADIVKDYLAKLRYHIEKNFTEFEYVARTEINSKALEQRGLLKYHLHMVFNNKDALNRWIITPELNDKLWQETIDKYTTQRYECKANKLEKVRQSLAGYLAEYCSKDEDEKWQAAAKKNGLQVIYPQQHYSMPHSLIKEIKQWEQEHKFQHETYQGGFMQLYDDMSHPMFRENVKGLKKDKKPILVTYINKHGEEKARAFVDFYNTDYTDIILDSLIENVMKWDFWNRRVAETNTA